MKHLIIGGLPKYKDLIDQLINEGHEVTVWDDFSHGKKPHFGSARYYLVSLRSECMDISFDHYDAIYCSEANHWDILLSKTSLSHDELMSKKKDVCDI